MSLSLVTQLPENGHRNGRNIQEAHGVHNILSHTLMCIRWYSNRIHFSPAILCYMSGESDSYRALTFAPVLHNYEYHYDCNIRILMLCWPCISV